MPVTAKLSKLFYDRLGEEIAQELVDWFNSADYSGNARRINQITFARIEQRFDALDARLEQRIGSLETNLKAAIARLEARVETQRR